MELELPTYPKVWRHLWMTPWGNAKSRKLNGGNDASLKINLIENAKIISIYLWKQSHLPHPSQQIFNHKLQSFPNGTRLESPLWPRDTLFTFPTNFSYTFPTNFSALLKEARPSLILTELREGLVFLRRFNSRFLYKKLTSVNKYLISVVFQ